jgi:hypothetical protein
MTPAEAHRSAPDGRKFIRHPSDIPIEVDLESVVASRREYLQNISAGGLCFSSRVRLAPGTLIHVRIPLVRPTFECDGRVVWCEERETHYDVGAQFVQSSEFRLRMVEQVCHIEHYKREVLVKDGRRLTSEEAAMEWIAKYAADFPQFNPPPTKAST